MDGMGDAGGTLQGDVVEKHGFHSNLIQRKLKERLTRLKTVNKENQKCIYSKESRSWRPLDKVTISYAVALVTNEGSSN